MTTDCKRRPFVVRKVGETWVLTARCNPTRPWTFTTLGEAHDYARRNWPWVTKPASSSAP